MDRKFMLWWRWLVAATVGVMLFGLGLVLLPVQMQRAFNVLYFASPGGRAVFEPDAVAYVTFIGAVLGAVMIGWGAILLFALFGPFRRGQQEGWRMIAVSLVAWFVPDTAFSLWSGFWQNAVLNCGLALLFAVPLAATYATFNADAPNQRVEQTVRPTEG